jgi:predicted Fe-Mo cluster-binding NifX family protein
MVIAMCVYKDRVSPLFDTTNRIYVAKIEDGKLVNYFGVRLTGMSVFDKIRKIQALGAELLIAGAISRPLSLLLESNGINVRAYVSAGIDELIREYIESSVKKDVFR